MNISIILGHPAAGSFNHALAQQVAHTAASLGHQVILHDLCAEGFDPLLPAAELARDAALPPDVATHCDEICAADGIVIIHPNWWSQPPAIIRGWTDRVLRAGRAYNFVPDGQGGAKPVGLLKAKAALVLNTANAPQEKEEALFGDPLEVLWRKVVFGLCGIQNIRRRNFTPVIVSTPAQRAAWLAETATLVQETFPRPTTVPASTARP